jgi:hypothetical protein
MNNAQTGSWARRLAAVGKDYGGLPKHSARRAQSSGPRDGFNTETEALLSGLVMMGTLPAPTANTLFVLTYPSTTTITDFADRPNCVLGSDGKGTLGGYHWEAQAGASKFAFAVLPTCSVSNEADIYLEVSASHVKELVEAMGRVLAAGNKPA